MKIVVACGGTGGHAFPGLAVAGELAGRGYDVTVWDSGRDVESSVMRNWNGKAFSTGAKQLSLGNVFANIGSMFRCRREMRKEKPDILLAMGSYSSLPPVLAASACSVPVVLHEANTVPGRAVEFLSRFARVVATSFSETAKYLPRARTVQTGLPIRPGMADGKRFDFIPKNSFVVFVTGGSQGAHAVNELMCDALVAMKREIDARGPGARPLYVIHQTGAKDEGHVIADAFASRGAADEAKQDELSAHQLCRYLISRYDKPERLAEMSRRMLTIAVPDAAKKVADLVEATAGSKLRALC